MGRKAPTTVGTKVGDATCDTKSKVDAIAAAETIRIDTEMEELRIKAIKSFKKGSTAKVCIDHTHLSMFPIAYLWVFTQCCRKAFKEMEKVIKMRPKDAINYMVRATLFHELDQVAYKCHNHLTHAVLPSAW